MAQILVAGLINLETTAKVQEFPVPYYPVHYPFFGVNNSISGVGFNIAKALSTLGDAVNFLSLVGDDFIGHYAIEEWHKVGATDRYLLKDLPATAQSVILYDEHGKRQINVDLKDIQERQYPPVMFEEAIQGCELAVLSNINFTRPFLAQTKALGIPIATDVHAISNLHDEYNRDYMSHADILFLSHENLPTNAEEFIHQLWGEYGTPIVVVGMGSEGALLGVKAQEFIGKFLAANIHPIVNTIGAGDALFSAFVHEYQRSHDPYKALRKAIVFAGYKIGFAGAADGFLSEAELDRLASQS